MDKCINNKLNRSFELSENEFILSESVMIYCNSACLELPLEDELLLNMLPSPHIYIHNLIKGKVNFYFKGLSSYRVDRSYLSRSLDGKLPSLNTLMSIVDFLALNLNDISVLFNVYGFAFGISLDYMVIYHAFKNIFSYLELVQLVKVYGSSGLNKFFMK